MLYSRYPEASLSRDHESNVLFTERIFFSFSDYEKKRVLVPHEETEGGGTAEGRNVKKWTTTMMTGGGGAFGVQDEGGGSARCAGRRARRGRWRGEGGMNKDEVYGSGGEEEGDGGVRRTKRAARSTG